MRYKRFFDLSIDMQCIANLDGFLLEINDAFPKTLGYSRSEILSKPYLDLVHPDDQVKTRLEMNKNQEGKGTLNFENRYRHSDGHYLTLSWNAQVDLENQLIYATVRNVTEQRNKEAKLSQIEQALYASSIIAETDKNGVITHINDKFCKISGYTRDELIGNTHKIVNSSTHSHSFFKDMWKTISSGEIWSGVIRNKTKAGEYYYVQTLITPIKDHENGIISYLSIRQDITESLNFKTELERTLDILNETNAIAKVGGWELEVDTGELTWTDETFRILEVEKNHNQKPVLPEGIELFIDEHKPIIENAVSRAIEFGEPYNLELQARTAKGNILWVYTNGRAHYKDGKIVTLSGTIQDIDEKKKTEIKYNLEKQKSIQSAKLASLGELAASMAHEINNPLGIISGYSELLSMSKDLNESQQAKLNTILKSCDRISHIVGNLKKFSRKEDHRVHAEHCLRDIIEEASSLANPRLKRELVDFKFLDHTPARIKCNPIEIEQVFLNLINNAVDALKDSENKKIEISLVETETSIKCKVVDTGHGIPEEIRGNIFNPFYTSKEVGSGTGLGLSIVKDILHEHDSDIEYDSNEPNTCFILHFPK